MTIKPRTPKIALLGCSGWISSYLVKALASRIPETFLVGTYANTPPTTKIFSKQLANTDIEEMLSFLEKEKVSAIVNLTRGETESDFLAHQGIIAFCNCEKIPYYYCSSFNACDAQLTHDHLESEQASAKSEYGKFKAKCEEELIKNCNHYAIFRFSATHGWAPNRISRTEEFLRKLKNNETVSVHRSIIQNRTAVTHLAAMMAAVIANEGRGIFHLGTVDTSDEIDFLKKLAQAFGYDPSKVNSNEELPTNANMVPKRILEMFGKEFEITEAETISVVSNMPGLQQYMFKHQIQTIPLLNDEIVINEVASFLHDGFGGTPEHYCEMLKLNLATNAIPFTMIALDKEKIIGTAGTYLKWGDENIGPWFGRLYVVPQYRKRGIAKLLFEAISLRCKKLGHSTLYLHTPSQENLYKTWGWQTIKKIERNNKTEAIMKMEI